MNFVRQINEWGTFGRNFLKWSTLVNGKPDKERESFGKLCMGMGVFWEEGRINMGWRVLGEEE